MNCVHALFCSETHVKSVALNSDTVKIEETLYKDRADRNKTYNGKHP